jgi:hypothetical protein
MPTFLDELRSMGAGVFLSARGIDSRVEEQDLWRAFEQPVILWAHGRDFDVPDADRLIELVRKIPHIQRFRFTSGVISRLAVSRLRETWPEVPIDATIAEPSDAPNDGPATSVENSEAPGGGRHR